MQRPSCAAGGGGRIADLARRIAAQAGGGTQIDLDGAQIWSSNAPTACSIPCSSGATARCCASSSPRPQRIHRVVLVPGRRAAGLVGANARRRGGQCRPGRAAHGCGRLDRLARAWWLDYCAAASQGGRGREYPQMVEEYLTDTLCAACSSRPLPRRSQRDFELAARRAEPAGRHRTARLEMAEADPARQPAQRGGRRASARRAARAAPEPLEDGRPCRSSRSPCACRSNASTCGSATFRTFSGCGTAWRTGGAKLRDVISERGLDYGLNDRMQHQLGLREGTLAEAVGRQGDCRRGHDRHRHFLREGAAIGTLFHAKSNLGPGQRPDPAAAGRDAGSQERQRRETDHRGPRGLVHLEPRRLDPFLLRRRRRLPPGHHQPQDRRVVSGHRPTASTNRSALGRVSPTRGEPCRWRATTRCSSISRQQFFDNLLGAALPDRARPAAALGRGDGAVSDRRAGRPGRSTSPARRSTELVAADLLPAGFGHRADGSHLVLVDGRPVDSLRGARGTFVPVPDVTSKRSRHARRQTTASFTKYYADQWGPMDPVAVGHPPRRTARREAGAGGARRAGRAAFAATCRDCSRNGWANRPTSGWRRCRATSCRSKRCCAAARSSPAAEHHLFGALRNADPAIVLEPALGPDRPHAAARSCRACKATWAPGPSPATCGIRRRLGPAGRRQRLHAAADGRLAAAVRQLHADVVPPADSRPGFAAVAIRQGRAAGAGLAAGRRPGQFDAWRRPDQRLRLPAVAADHRRATRGS